MEGPGGYTRLTDPRAFRLLKILDISNSDGTASLRCSLDAISLDDHCPAFVALSYTWGCPFEDEELEKFYSQDHDKVITISHDGRPPRELRIGRNLFDALTHTHKLKWQSYLWADAICINQVDPDERASQVHLMGDIYTKPVFVLAWLGPEPSNMKIDDILWWYGPFMDYLGEYARKQQKAKDIADFFPTAGNHTDRGLGQQVLSLPDTDIRVTRSMIGVLGDWFSSVRYFHRTWVLQELTLPRKVVYLLGSHCLSEDSEPEEVDDDDVDPHSWLWQWQSFNAETSRWLVVNLATMQRIPLKPPPMPVAMSAFRSRAWISRPEKPEDRYHAFRAKLYGATSPDSHACAMFELILTRSRHLSATDPRDRIYGILGLIDKALPSSLGVAPSKAVAPVDYERSIEDVLKAVTVRLLTTLPYMTCFALRPAACYPRIYNLPSWVVDSTVGEHELQPGGLSALREQPFNAFPNRSKENEVVEIDGDTLKLYGHFCGRLSICMDGFVHNMLSPDQYDQHQVALDSANFVALCLELAISHGPEYRAGSGELITAAIHRMLIGPTGLETLSEAQKNPSSFWVLVKRSLWTLVELAKMETVERTPDNLKRADTAKGYIGRFRSSLPKLVAAGVPVSDSLLRYANKIATGYVSLPTFEDDEFYESESSLATTTMYNLALLNRALFWTDNRLLGTAADDAQPGDQVWILCRARVPQILRPLDDGTFVTLGEAYVHGGVDGELFDLGLAGPLTKISIV